MLFFIFSVGFIFLSVLSFSIGFIFVWVLFFVFSVGFIVVWVLFFVFSVGFFSVGDSYLFACSSSVSEMHICLGVVLLPLRGSLLTHHTASHLHGGCLAAAPVGKSIIINIHSFIDSMPSRFFYSLLFHVSLGTSLASWCVGSLRWCGVQPMVEL